MLSPVLELQHWSCVEFRLVLPLCAALSLREAVGGHAALRGLLLQLLCRSAAQVNISHRHGRKQQQSR